jgi:hypothetical protein
MYSLGIAIEWVQQGSMSDHHAIDGAAYMHLFLS